MTSQSLPRWRQWLGRHWAWLLVILTVLFVLGVRLRLRDMPLERDEGEYAYAGQLILHGVPPYTQAYNMKLPGTYAAYAVFMALFGQTPTGIHLGVALVNAGSIVLLFLLGRRLLDEVAGAASALVFGLMSLSPYVYGLAAHATQFVVLPALGGTLLLLKGMQKEECRMRKSEGGTRSTTVSPVHSPSTIHYQLLCSGLLFGLAFLMKQHGLFFGLFGLVYLVWVRWSECQAAQAERRLVVAPRAAPARLSHLAAAKLKQPGPNPTPQTPGSNGPSPEMEPQSSVSEVQPAEPSAPSPATSSASRSALPAPRFTAFLPEVAVFCAGLAAPYLLTCLVLAGVGAFPQFVFWTISYARQYAALEPVLYGADFLKAGLRAVVGPNVVFWVLPWFGLLVIWWETRLGKAQRRRSQGSSPRSQGSSPKPAGSSPSCPSPSSQAPAPIPHAAFRTPYSALPAPRFFLQAFLFASFGSVSVGLYFRPHYFITLLPALALLSGILVSRAVYVVGQGRSAEMFLALPVFLFFLIGLGAVLLGNSTFWFGTPPNEVVRRTYGSTIFAQTRQVGEYIRAHAAPGARVAVLGSEPEVFFYSNRRSASGYIYVYPLMEPQSFALKMQQDTIAETERARPEYIVYVQDNFSWLRGPASEHKLDDWWADYAGANLDLVMTVRIEEELESDAPNLTRSETPAPAKPEKYLLVYCRKRAAEKSANYAN